MPAVSTLAGSALAWASLNMLTKRRYDVLRERFGGLEEAWGHLNPELLRNLGCKEETALRVLANAREFDGRQATKELEERGITLLTIEDQAYPDLLRKIADPPVFLFGQGNLALLREPAIAIVGTRNMSAYGKRIIEALVPEFVATGLVTVSGLAQGIDAEVARQTLKAGGKTIAVLGHGLGAIYPRSNTTLAEALIKGGGLLVTEFPLHVNPDTYTFPARNRIIAGVTLGTIVAEAAAQSGSLITASLALEYGREVFAVPGQIFDPQFAGTHELVARGCAKLIRSAGDVLAELGVVAPEKTKGSSYRAQTPEEGALLTHLTTLPQSADDLIEKSGLPVAAVSATLTLMELKGGAKNVGMGMWVRA